MAEKKGGMIRYMKYSVVGIELAASIAVGAFIGSWLDGKLGTEPWMFIFWSICGTVAGFRSLYLMAKQYLKENKKDENQGPNGT